VTSIPQVVPSKVDDEYKRDYLSEVLQTRIYGALLSAAEHRKTYEGLTRKEVAEKTGKDETAISKLFAKPQNFTLKTISDLAYALDLEIEFAFVSRANRDHVFLDVGFRNRHLSRTNTLAQGATVNLLDSPTTTSALLRFTKRPHYRLSASRGQAVLTAPGMIEPAKDAAP
jgi:DNA-binding phage protein